MPRGRTDVPSLGSTNRVPTKQTQARVVEVAKGIAKGWSRLTALERIKEMYDVGDDQALKYYASAIKYLVPDDPEFRQRMINKNIARLENIIEQSLQDGDMKVANECIRTLNQMMGIGGNKVTIGQADPDGTQKVIEISFD